MVSRFAALRPYLLSFPLLIGGLVIYKVAETRLNKRFPDISLESLPEWSFVRRLAEDSRQVGLSPWKDAGDKRLWAPYCDAYQATVPRRFLDSYQARLPSSSSASLSAIFSHAFSNSGIMRLERSATWTKPDAREERALFEPDQEIVRGLMRVFESDGAPSASMTSYEQPMLPPCAAPGISKSSSTSSTVLYWQMAPSVVQGFDKLAEWGYPWRMMLGGWHELLVEELPDTGPEPVVRLTFLCVHIYDTLGKDDRKVIPKWVQHFHEVFAKACLASTLRRLER